MNNKNKINYNNNNKTEFKNIQCLQSICYQADDNQ